MARKKTTKRDEDIIEAVEQPTANENGAASLDFADYSDAEAGGINLIDFSDIPDQELIPDGSYVVTCEKAKAKKSKAGFPMLNLQLKAALKDGSEQRLWDNMSFKPGQASQITKRNLIQWGIDATFKGNLEQLAEAMIGRSATAVIFTRPATEQYEASNAVKRYSAVKAKVADLI